MPGINFSLLIFESLFSLIFFKKLLKLNFLYELFLQKFVQKYTKPRKILERPKLTRSKYAFILSIFSNTNHKMPFPFNRYLFTSNNNKWSPSNAEVTVIWFQGRKYRVLYLGFASDSMFLRWSNGEIIGVNQKKKKNSCKAV